MAKKKKKSNIKVPVVFAIIIVVVVALFVKSKLVFTCDSCHKTTFGAGYEPNFLTSTFNDEERICEDCARDEHGNSSFYEHKLDIVLFSNESEDED